jgi:hypothetical protein
MFNDAAAEDPVVYKREEEAHSVKGRARKEDEEGEEEHESALQAIFNRLQGEETEKLGGGGSLSEDRAAAASALAVVADRARLEAQLSAQIQARRRSIKY